MMGIYVLSGYYNNVYAKSRVSEFTITLKCALIGTLLVLFSVLINDLTMDRTFDYSLLALLLGLLFTVVYIPRHFITRALFRMIRQGTISFPTIIIGYSSHLHMIEEQLDKIGTFPGICPVMLCDADNHSDNHPKIRSLPITNLSQITDCNNRCGAERIILIPHPTSWDRTLSIINSLITLDLNIYVAADNLPPYLFNTHLPNIVSEPFIDVTRAHMSESTLNLKRASDIFVSAIMLAISAIPLAGLAIAVKANSNGPAFFKQQRIGLRRKPFTIYKLRTMVAEAELSGQPALSHEGDQRVTSLGRVLRKYHLDELPQFYNVLKGDMSLVGPRPERMYFIEKIIEREPAYALIHRVRPGITSLGMVKFGYASNVDDMIRRSRYDLLYLENISIVTDLKILLYTAHNVLSGKGV